ncbi:hypothetical protein ONZ45_g1800 [Pleurotus djamor]|nr:hypothetical protein ONZ45_g1800 [Pleurotus djamor]
MAQVWKTYDESSTQGIKSFDTQYGDDIFRPDILKSLGETMSEMDADLRKLSIDIHEHPEVGFKEFHAHDVMTKFLEDRGFQITRKYLLETAWKAEFSNGNGGRVIGINSEMDALPNIGHACGHNLIGMSGIAVACAMKAALEKHNIDGKIVVLGTPAEEGGGGKVILLEKGAYEGMDICLMCHPAPGPKGSVSLSSCLALSRVRVEFSGHTAHAALSPWEAQNALDAAVLSYNNIAALRQQIKPTHRVHGIIEGKEWVPGIIPDKSNLFYYIRAPTTAELEILVKRVLPCFEAAALATGCKADIKLDSSTNDLRQNTALGDEVGKIAIARGGAVDYEWGIASASTDFGNVTYALPSLHPGFSIPTEENGGNHTRAFTASALRMDSHYATIDVSIALAATGIRILLDDAFFGKVQSSFEEDKKRRAAGL